MVTLDDVAARGASTRSAGVGTTGAPRWPGRLGAQARGLTALTHRPPLQIQSQEVEQMETITYTQDGQSYELPVELVRLIRQDHRHRGTRSKHRMICIRLTEGEYQALTDIWQRRANGLPISVYLHGVLVAWAALLQTDPRQCNQLAQGIDPRCISTPRTRANISLHRRLC